MHNPLRSLLHSRWNGMKLWSAMNLTKGKPERLVRTGGLFSGRISNRLLSCPKPKVTVFYNMRFGFVNGGMNH